MESVVVDTLGPAKDRYTANNGDDLHRILSDLATRFKSEPTFVVLKAENGDAILIGLGIDHTTVEMMLQGRTKHARSMSNGPSAVKMVRFSYSGEWTEVEPKYLVPTDKGIAAAIKWFAEGDLDNRIRWAIDSWPPKKRKPVGEARPPNEEK